MLTPGGTSGAGREAAEAGTSLMEKVTPAQWGLVALLVLSAMINYVDRQATSVISPILVKTFQLSGEQWGLVNAVFSLTYIFTSALGGIWVDRVGVRKALMLSTAFWSVAAAGHALATDFQSLCFWRMMLAIGEGPGGACLLKGIRQSLPTRFQDTGIGLVGAGTLLGALLAPLTVLPLAVAYGWQAAFLVTAAVGTVWMPFWWLAAGRQGKRLDVPAPAASATGKREWLNLRSPGIWATMVAIFFTIPPSVFTLSFLALYLSDTFHLPPSALGGLQWQPYMAMDLGQLAAATTLPLLMRKGLTPLAARRCVMVFGFTASTLMLVMAAAPTLGVAMTALNISRFCFQFAYVALLAYGVSCVRPDQAGRMNGLMNAAFGACNFAFNPLIGKLTDIYNHNYQPVIIMVSLSPLIGLTGWLVLSQVAARRAPEPFPDRVATPAQ
jgi:ACS family hexuronate transporter-like MFS transporter